MTIKEIKYRAVLRFKWIAYLKILPQNVKKKNYILKELHKLFMMFFGNYTKFWNKIQTWNFFQVHENKQRIHSMLSAFSSSELTDEEMFSLNGLHMNCQVLKLLFLLIFCLYAFKRRKVKLLKYVIFTFLSKHSYEQRCRSEFWNANFISLSGNKNKSILIVLGNVCKIIFWISF